ncbi:DNA polymerase III gamma/tau subunits [Candidatus Termititenax aidoneus]|uniref:DNA polymerase III subunit gamma/tau n=1 Tax=Termititenax aidoneus TaxID=2218524 RepID=A0A388T8T8_TERA1|nr:DNA polymerase III gamma/tau subunits [Candidatus Termititenax aidoneus]
MAYLALYRKYRSQDFDTIIGQRPIVQTLKNALQQDKLAHAYIFAGPRGTGKTSLARILAKALNCADGVTIKPCCQCPMCEKIRDGTAVDIIELDAASNRGIDEIRKLREQVNYNPLEQNCRYKVYIIDEAHMLTTEAFNALLKTLEEPPGQTVFVLATTEIQKIPPTILSRCQRFDFKRITVPEIEAHLKAICQKENVTVDDRTVNYLARLADGCMRDALSLLDRLISAEGAAITFDQALAALGSALNTALAELLEKIIARELTGALEITGRWIADGKDLRQVGRDLLDCLRDLLLLSLRAEQALDLSAEDLAALQSVADQTTAAELKRMIAVFARAEQDMRWNPNVRLVFELAVMELCAPPNETPPLKIPADQNRAALSSPPPRSAPRALSGVETPPSAHSAAAATPQTINMAAAHSAAAPPLLDPNQPLTFADVKQSWDFFLNKVKQKKPLLLALLCEARPKNYADGSVILQLKESYGFHKNKLLEPQNKNFICELLKDVYGRELNFAVVLEAYAAEPADQKTQWVKELFSN